MEKKDQPEWMTNGRSATLYSINQNIRALMPQECASCVAFLRAKEETLWLAKLSKSLHGATAENAGPSFVRMSRRP
jgi:hypothetical protein